MVVVQAMVSVVLKYPGTVKTGAVLDIPEASKKPVLTAPASTFTTPTPVPSVSYRTDSAREESSDLVAAYAPWPGTALTLTSEETKQTRPNPRSIMDGRNRRVSRVGAVQFTAIRCAKSVWWETGGRGWVERGWGRWDRSEKQAD